MGALAAAAAAAANIPLGSVAIASQIEALLFGVSSCARISPQLIREGKFSGLCAVESLQSNAAQSKTTG